MARLKNPVKLMAHEHPCLSLAAVNEAGIDVHIEFSAGYATVDDPYILEQLLDSPVRGDDRPAHFRILALDNQVRDQIALARQVPSAPALPPVAENEVFVDKTLPDAILAVLKAHPAMSFTRAQVDAAVIAGGYPARQPGFSLTVNSALRELARKDLVSSDGTEWKFKGK